ncbi:E3 ubiquitin-protein ligase TRIM39-like [Paramisgurnus dabryanus]|uniref:E3 ubiquitin-protein ligase TRIM39-like n=1 Tax=Paramisgurnus dabryanus TaxID=90735 RepID=UPI0031F35F38
METQTQKSETQKSEDQTIKVNVTLDPDSAHPDLIVSDDGKQMRYEYKVVEDGEKEQNNTYFCVLGKQGFTSGCFFYELQVKGERWFVGVAKDSVKREGEICLNPKNGFWTIGRRDGMYVVCDDPYIPLNVKPQKVRVSVNYEEGRVSFCDESMCHIHSFTDQSFHEKLYPFFSLAQD